MRGTTQIVLGCALLGASTALIWSPRYGVAVTLLLLGVLYISSGSQHIRKGE